MPVKKRKVSTSNALLGEVLTNIFKEVAAASIAASLLAETPATF